MIQELVDRFMAQKDAMIAGFAATPPASYDDLFRTVVVCLSAPETWKSPDPERITAIDHGEYQGTRLFVVAACGYQPGTHWACAVSYGSCSGCDTFEYVAYCQEESERPRLFWDMALHMVQSLVEVSSCAG